jgi:hypothetical protein
MVANMWGKKIRFAGILVGCCLWVATCGCGRDRQATRNDSRSLWSLSGGHPFWQKPSSVEKNNSDQADRHPAQTDTLAQTSVDGPSDTKQFSGEGKPELLPWRSRLKSFRAGARMAREREAASSDAQHPATVGMPPDSRRPDLVVD